MITILTSADRQTRPQLFDQMFRGRALVFHDRLGWDVNVLDGWETDRYDDEEPVYLVSTDTVGNMLGSLRLLPTTGDTMLQNEFRNFFDEPVDIRSPTAWECTRFCVHPQSEVADLEYWRAAASELLIELCSLALNSGMEHIIGVYERPMARIYRRIGWEPELLARSRDDLGQLAVGVWEVSDQALYRMRAIALTKGFQSQSNRFA
jgi:N-acyl-L-homoserine lactone synthetase